METLPTRVKKSMSLSDLNSKHLPTQQYEVIEAELVKPEQHIASYEVKEIVDPVDPMKKKYGRLANIAGSVMAMHSEQKEKKIRL